MQGGKKAKTLARRTWKDSMVEDVESEDTEEDGKAKDGGPKMGAVWGHEEVGQHGRTTRQAGLVAKTKLEKYCTSRHVLADIS